MFFDQWKVFYNAYSVLSATIKVKIGCTSGGDVGCVLTTTASNPDSGGGFFDTMCERPGVRTTIVTPQRPTQLSGRWSSKAWSAERQFNTAGMTTNPTASWYWNLGFYNLNGGALAGANPSVMVTINYKALLTEPVIMSGS